MLFRYDRAGKVRKVQRADQSWSVVLDLALPGVYPYRNADGSVDLELVEASVLNDPAYLASLSQAVVTCDHPDELVTAENASKYNRGNLGDSITPSENDGPISGIAIIRDAALQADVDSGKRQQVSCGYEVEVDSTPGVHPKWGRYDRKQTRRISNHVAIVTAARHGARARIRSDAAEQIDSEDIMVVSAELRAHLDKLGVAKDCVDPVVIADALAKEADKQAGRADAADAKRGEAETALATEKKARTDAAAAPVRLDAFKEHAPLVARLTALGLPVEGTPADARKAIVLKVYPEARKDASDDYYQGFLANEQPRNPYKPGSTDFAPDPAKQNGDNGPLVVEPPPRLA